jgi:hypothetical protein
MAAAPKGQPRSLPFHRSSVKYIADREDRTRILPHKTLPTSHTLQILLRLQKEAGTRRRILGG